MTTCLAPVTLTLTLCSVARADPLRLRADAYTDTRDPTGLVVLRGYDAHTPWLSSEAVAWLGARGDATGDVLTMALRMRDPTGHGELRLGRFVQSTGAIRPVHIDGASVLGRVSSGTTAEVFGGVPVVPRFGDRAYDWVLGARLGQSVAERASVGVSYLHRRDHGDVADEEVGADFAATPWRSLDVAARAAYDLTSPGLTDANVSAAMRTSAVRVELFGSRRTPSRLLPATSLFSVFGDTAATRLGSTVSLRAAPRLDVLVLGATTVIEERVGYDATIRATLRTDDDGRGQVGLELRRQGVASAAWLGVRAIAIVPVGRSFRTSTELELVRPDDSQGRGALWPWGIVSVGWKATSRWDVAAAIEAGATPTASRQIAALGRASFAWDAR